MKINKTLIGLKKLNGITINGNVSENVDNYNVVMTLNVNLMASFGYMLSNDLIDAMRHLEIDEIENISNEINSSLATILGSDVKHKPMYPNFPQQVINATNRELLFNAIAHYLSLGWWKPNQENVVREFALEPVKYEVIQNISEHEFLEIFTKILSSNDSISEQDREIVEWFIDNYEDVDLVYPSTIPFKENLCLVASIMLQYNKNIDKLVSTGTDVMRVYAHLSNQDISLGSKIWFKNLSRNKRRILTKTLEKVLNSEDLKRRPKAWVHMFHQLHVGDYSKPVYDLSKKVRENHKIESFNSKVENAINNLEYDVLMEHLKMRPGDFTRRLDEIMRKFDNRQQETVAKYVNVARNVPTRTLTQIWGHIKNRTEKVNQRYVFPKGSMQKAVVVKRHDKALDTEAINMLIGEIQNILIERFSTMESLGKVYLDDSLKKSPLPTQQRSASTGKYTVSRGTRLPIEGDKNTLRLFIYWVGRDIDLSASFYDENFNYVDHISYTNLRDDKLKAYHSGDIVDAPNGASEFIDIDMETVKNNDRVRYVVMNVFVFTGPTFSEHDTVYAGWMTRQHPNSNEIYDPTTVNQKIDLETNTYSAVPAIFDIENKEVIWCDIAMKSLNRPLYRMPTPKVFKGGNNIEANYPTVQEMLNFFVNNNDRITLYDLFNLHVHARGEHVNDRVDSDLVFSFDGDVTPYHINDINSEFLA